MRIQRTPAEAIVRLAKLGTMVSTVALILSVALQIFARFVLANTPPWTEEVSRLFFIYATAFAAGLAVLDGEYVRLDLFYDRQNPKVQKTLDQLARWSTIVLFCLLGYGSLFFVARGWQETSPSMKISMAWAFLSITVMSLGIVYFSLSRSTETKNIIEP